MSRYTWKDGDVETYTVELPPYLEAAIVLEQTDHHMMGSPEYDAGMERALELLSEINPDDLTEAELVAARKAYRHVKTYLESDGWENIHLGDEEMAVKTETDSQGTKVYWEGPIGFEDQTTGDGRHIAEGALEWTATEEDPIPLRFVREDVGAHANAEVVGAITSIERREREENGIPIWGKGWLDVSDSSETGKHAAHLIREKMQRGISMDLDDASFEEIDTADGASMTEILSARIRGATLVAIPAFAGAIIEVVDEEANVRMGKEELALNEQSEGVVIALLPADGEPIAADTNMPLVYLGEMDSESSESVREEIVEVVGLFSPILVRGETRGPSGEDEEDTIFFEQSSTLR